MQLSDALDALHRLLCFSARDWAGTETDAILWAVLVGWGDEEDVNPSADEVYEELQGRFGWSNEYVELLKRRCQAVKQARES